mmetsp:Transcript_74017/g.192202  ORF Transcript_74017/g.192202 Transcript_74017/m.192202 type:complete len:113 (-) Transcript_74017:418-756(-)
MVLHKPSRSLQNGTSIRPNNYTLLVLHARHATHNLYTKLQSDKDNYMIARMRLHPGLVIAAQPDATAWASKPRVRGNLGVFVGAGNWMRSPPSNTMGLYSSGTDECMMGLLR